MRDVPRLLALGASLVLAAGGCGHGPTDGGERRPNLLLISIDTLRADRLGCYGYGRDTSPALDRFAARCVRFEHAIAPAPWTLPSHVSMLSGLLPQRHAVQLPGQTPGPDTVLLAERLWKAGSYTFGITDGGFVSAAQGFDRGFRAFYDQNRRFAETVHDAETYITDRRPYGPWFGFLHTYDVHCPYDADEPYRSMFESPGRVEADIDGKCGNPWLNDMHLTPEQAEYVSDRYDGGIRQVDDALGGLLEFLQREGYLDDTVVVFTSDHGEELQEHGKFGHERSVHRELLEVPLLIYAPGLEPGVVAGPVSLVDIVPTVLDLLDLPVPDGLDGRSLLPLIAGKAQPDEGEPSSLRWKASLDAWWTPTHQLEIDHQARSVALYDVRVDPTTQTNRITEEPDLAGTLAEAMARRLAPAIQGAHAPGKSVDVDAEAQAQLRGLGYGGGPDDGKR